VKGQKILTAILAHLRGRGGCRHKATVTENHNVAQVLRRQEISLLSL
jgi:hypothetical protein